MSAEELTFSCSKAIKSGNYAFVVINFANPDMVGHTGNMDATIKAIEKVDKCIGQIVNATGEMGGSILITADHGNAEVMNCLLYTSPSPRDGLLSRMPSSA